jgi:hypothetical protein
VAFASLSDLVQHYENAAGDPTALNYRYDSTHTASGLYQITNTTWNGFGGFPSAAAAPADVQRAKFADLVSSRGLTDWLPYNANLRNYVTNNPDAMNLPVTGGLSADPAQGLANLSAASGGAGGTGAAQGTADSGTGIVSGITGYISGVAGRALYAIVGLVLIAMAVFVYALRTKEQG